MLEILTDQPPVVATGAPAGVTQTAATIPRDRRSEARSRRRCASTSARPRATACRVGRARRRQRARDDDGRRAARRPHSGHDLPRPRGRDERRRRPHGRRRHVHDRRRRRSATRARRRPRDRPLRVRRKRTKVVSLSRASLGKGVVRRDPLQRRRLPVHHASAIKPQTRRRPRSSLTSLFKRRTLRAGARSKCASRGAEQPGPGRALHDARDGQAEAHEPVPGGRRDAPGALLSSPQRALIASACRRRVIGSGRPSKRSA